MLEDARFFQERMSKIDGAADLGDHILNVVKGKEVKIVRETDDDQGTTVSTDSEKTVKPVDAK